MSIRNVCGQHFFIGISGPALTNDEKQFVVKNNISGVTLFGRNIQTPEQLHALVTELQSLRHQMPDKAPLFIAIDMEGGRVARLKKPFTEWPPVGKIGAIDSATLAFKFTEAMGNELRAFGINLNFAPCVDVLSNPKNELIGDRSLGSNPEVVAKLASALVRGFIKSDIIPCAKHYPGHGNTIVDSHFDLPVENASLEILRNRELIPFKKTFRARLDFVMTAHMMFPEIDPNWPVTLSQKFLKDILRGEYRYRQFVITDDLDMKALTKKYSVPDIPVFALRAGADFLLYCNEPSSPPVGLESVEKAIRDGKIVKSEMEERYKKILDFKSKKLTNPDPRPLETALKTINSDEHKVLADMIVRGEGFADAGAAEA